MNEIMRVAACCCLILIFSCGCETFRTEPVAAPAPKGELSMPKEDIAESEALVLKAGDKFLDQMLAAMADDDYALFAKHFTIEMRTRITEDKFNALTESFKKARGEFKSKQYLGMLKQGVLRTLMWKAEFGDSGNDTLIRLTLGKVDGEFEVFGFWLQ